MRAFTDYESTQEFTENIRLPAGAYEVTIKSAEDNDDALCLLFDSSAGEYRDYFMNKFRNDKNIYPDTAKFKGVYRLWYPKGNESDETNKMRMKTVLKLIKEENKLNIDYSKEWDGAALKGSRIGMILRDQEYHYNGYHGFTAQPYGVISMEALRTGKYTVPEPKRLNDSDSFPDSEKLRFFEINVEDDLPF